MKTLQEVNEALAVRADSAQIKQLGGFSYMPWNVSTRIANDVFGFLGWSSTVIECKLEIVDLINRDGVATRHQGYKTIVRITVRVRDETGIEIESNHDGVGFGELQSMGNKNAIDTAVKAAASDGVSRALKLFGDALGLFLYDKEDPTSGTQPQANKSSYSNTGNDKVYPVSPGRIPHLKSNFNLTDAQIQELGNAKAGIMLDRLWKEKVAKQDILVAFGFAPGSGVPVGASTEEDPF